MNTIEKRKKGRPFGSNSFTNVTLAELNAKYGENDVIPVGRLFLERGKVTPQKSIPAVSTDPVALAPQSTTPPVEMTLSA